MIDTGKLLTNRSNRSTSLSRKSVINIGLIRDDVIKIDGLLKTRLVLSKVRDGIERQNQERLRRRSREDNIERDDDRDDDDNDKRDPKPKKGGGGLLGFLVGGVLAVVGGIALKFLPQILALGKFITKIAKVFTFVVGGTFTALKGFLIQFNAGSEKLKGIDKDKLREGYVNDVFSNFNGAIRNVVFGIIAAAGVAYLMRLRIQAQESMIRDSLMAMGKRARTPSDDDLIKAAAKQLGLDLDDLTKPFSTGFTRGRRATRIPGGVGAKSGSLARGTLTFSGDAKYQKLKKEMLEKSSEKTKKVFNTLGMDDPTSGYDFKQLSVDEQIEYQKILNEEAVARSRSLPLKEQNLIKKNVREGEKIIENITNPKKIKKIFGQSSSSSIGGGIGSSTMKQAPMLTEGFNPLSGFINPNKFFKTNKQILEGSDLLSAPKLSKTLLKQKGGISRALVSIGGEGFAATFKQGLKSAVGIIPILGDLIGILLDIFIFGEPVGRAIFKGIGSFAIGSLLGALGFAVGGPIGAFIGGVAGGIGGDILGGIVYDMFFNSNRGVSGKSAGTKGVIKGATQSFEEGGFVGKPSFKPMVNSDKSTDLRVTASYDRPSAGRVKFIPIPLPIPSKEQSQQEEQIAMNKTTTKTRTFAGLYQR